MADSNPSMRRVWQWSALSGLLAFAIEWFVGWMDEKDAKLIRAEHAELQERIRPRSLTSEQRAAIISVLKPLKGPEVTIECPVDPETEEYASELYDVIV